MNLALPVHNVALWGKLVPRSEVTSRPRNRPVTRPYRSLPSSHAAPTPPGDARDMSFSWETRPAPSLTLRRRTRTRTFALRLPYHELLGLIALAGALNPWALSRK